MDPAVSAASEIHHAVDLGEQRVVLAHTNVLTGLQSTAALTHQDRASGDGLPGETLDA